ncbi:hypothetical protein NECID01_1200 [Nematocida sp. AWRm77]|nr:hypothetical protein NECID01_1200 [Nematocida sp. AWRm77]
MAKIAPNMLLLIWAHALLVCSTGFGSLEFEPTGELEMLCADINPDNFYSDYSDILDFLPRDNVQSVLQEEQALESSCVLNAPGPSNAVNTVGVNEGSSASVSASLSFPDISPASSASSVQVQSPAGSAKRACDRAEKEDEEQKVCKRQKTETTTLTAAETNSALMDETEACLAIEEFNRYFGEDTKVWINLSRSIIEFSKDLAQRGLTSVHSSEIVDLCTAPKKWLGHSVFWRMLMFFVDILFLYLTDLKRLEDKKTVVLRDRNKDSKPLSEYSYRSIYDTLNRCQGAERMEIECSLCYLEGRGMADVLGVLRWFLYHVKIKYVGITCDLTETGIHSEVLERQMEALTKEWKGKKIHIDSLSLYFNLAQYKEAAVIVKECPIIPALKIHFLDAALYQGNNINQTLEALLLHCPALEKLSIFGLEFDIEYIQMIAAMLPQLVLLEIELLSLDTLVLDLEEEKESIPLFPGLKTLKLTNIYHHSDVGIEKFVELFPNLKDVQISAIDVTIPLIDALSKPGILRSLEIINSSLPIKTAEYLLDKLLSLEYLSVGAKQLDTKLGHALSKCTNMRMLNLRGNYIPGFFSSLLRPSPLMSTLKYLSVYKYSGSCRGNLSAEDLSSKKAAIKNFGCTIEIRR